ncbi:MAG: site-specific integrase [Lachnospiraceae bacterium]|nr:site-specific integrase [Lachnospiraceae bacterium]
MPGNSKKHRRGNGEGSIYQRKDGSWAAAITVGVKPDGKPDRKFLYGKTRKEVADKLRDAQNNLDLGVIPGGNNVTFKDWVTYWLEKVIRPGIKDRTYKNYKTSIYSHIVPGIGRYKLKDLTEETIRDYLTAQQESGNLKLAIDEETGEPEPSHTGVAASSIIQQRRLIIACLEYAVEKKKITINVAKKTKRPKKANKVMNVLTDEDMEILATKGVKYRYYAAYMLTLSTGCRRGEILGMEWKHIDIGIPWRTVDDRFPWGEIRSITLWDTKALKGVLTAHNIILGYGYINLVQQMADDAGTPVIDELKTDLSRRSLMITEEMILLLIFWRMLQHREKLKVTLQQKEYNREDLVFCTRKGTYIYPRNFSKTWSENLKSMGIDHKRFHDLRHTVATVMLEDGEAMNTVQEQLGHYDAGFTASRYGHVTPKMKNNAAVKLGERLKTARGGEDNGSEYKPNVVTPEEKVVTMDNDVVRKATAVALKSAARKMG